MIVYYTSQCASSNKTVMSDVLCALFQLLNENDQLVRCITEYMQKGRAIECVQ